MLWCSDFPGTDNFDVLAEREPVFGHLPISHMPDSNPFNCNDITLDSAGLQSTSQNREKESDYYMDKSVTECELPELIICYNDSSCNTIKDICIDEGLPSQDKSWVETGLDEKACCTYLPPDEDQNKQMHEEQLDIVITFPDDFKSTAKNDLEKGFSIACNSKEPMERGDAINDGSERTAIDVSKEDSCPENVQGFGAGNPHSKSSNKDSNEAEQETIQISREIAKTKSPALVSETEESNYIEKEALVSAAEESNCLLGELSGNSKAESGNITSALDVSAHVSITTDVCPQNGVCNMPIDDDSHDECQFHHCLAPVVTGREECPENGVHLDTSNTFNVGGDISDPMIVSSQVEHRLAPVVTGREECPENGVCQHLDASNTSKVDDDISDSKIVSSQVQHYLAPSTIARDECPENGVCQGLETSNTTKVNDDTSDSKIVSSQVHHWLSPETSYISMVEDVNADAHNAALQFQLSLGESSFSAAGHFSSLITSSPYSGNVSLRSESSTTSTRSFAFPVLQSEWNSSPVRMAKADRSHLRKHRGWRGCFLCCRF
ncbi:hypothetical protein ACFX13_021188 [Malus domestica]|uniref:uncharacterized protein isoform X1 n=1 Tax=Malus domestica TaxID=3750 RepID=UPI003976CEE1